METRALFIDIQLLTTCDCRQNFGNSSLSVQNLFPRGSVTEPALFAQDDLTEVNILIGLPFSVILPPHTPTQSCPCANVKVPKVIRHEETRLHPLDTFQWYDTTGQTPRSDNSSCCVIVENDGIESPYTPTLYFN